MRVKHYWGCLLICLAAGCKITDPDDPVPIPFIHQGEIQVNGISYKLDSGFILKEYDLRTFTLTDGRRNIQEVDGEIFAYGITDDDITLEFSLSGGKWNDEEAISGTFEYLGQWEENGIYQSNDPPLHITGVFVKTPTQTYLMNYKFIPGVSHIFKSGFVTLKTDRENGYHMTYRFSGFDGDETLEISGDFTGNPFLTCCGNTAIIE